MRLGLRRQRRGDRSAERPHDPAGARSHESRTPKPTLLAWVILRAMETSRCETWFLGSNLELRALSPGRVFHPHCLQGNSC